VGQRLESVPRPASKDDGEPHLDLTKTLCVLDIVSEGGHDDDMSTDSRDVMPGRMGGEEKVKARGEDGRVNHETAPTIKQG
jgi:hypothetical protein